MKKLLVIMLMMVYGFSSTGMTISFQYCCGKLKNVEWSAVNETLCGSEHKMGSKPCCETKQISNKQTTDQDNYQLLVKDFRTFSEVAKPFTATYNVSLISTQPSPVAFTPPPLLSRLFLLNCVFRI
jgi:hypothetical protein